MLDIVIVSYNCRDVLDACLRSLDEPHRRPQHIVVVDNASDDGTPAHLKANWPQVTLIEPGRNLGFAAATNVGIRATRGELVLLLNPDTLIPSGAIDRLADALEGDSPSAIAGPRIVDAHGRAELSFGAMISPLVELRQKVLVKGNDRNWPMVSGIVERMTSRRRHPDWVSGACLLIRRPVLEAAGLLDERFFLYTEDVDLCAAVRARGHGVLFVPDVSIVHLRGRSAAAAPRVTRAAYRRSHVAFYEKHHPWWARLLKRYLRIRGEWPV